MRKLLAAAAVAVLFAIAVVAWAYTRVCGGYHNPFC